MKVSWQKRIQEECEFYRRLADIQSREITELKKSNDLLLRLVNEPPTIMIACEKIVDAAARQVTDMLQFVKEAKR